MRHHVVTKKFGRSTEHRRAMLAALVCGLILEKRICTTLPKAKAARQLAERLVTIAKSGTLAARRRVLAALRRRDVVKLFFDEVVPACAGRSSGYTRIIKVGARVGDGSPTAFLEWLDVSARSRKKPSKTEEENKAKTA